MVHWGIVPMLNLSLYIMGKATFHSLRGEKSALVGVKINEFTFGNDFVYLSRAGVLSAIGKTEEEAKKLNWEDQIIFDIPDGYKVVDIPERHAEDGSPLKTLAW